MSSRFAIGADLPFPLHIFTILSRLIADHCTRAVAACTVCGILRVSVEKKTFIFITAYEKAYPQHYNPFIF